MSLRVCQTVPLLGGGGTVALYAIAEPRVSRRVHALETSMRPHLDAQYSSGAVAAYYRALAVVWYDRALLDQRREVTRAQYANYGHPPSA